MIATMVSDRKMLHFLHELKHKSISEDTFDFVVSFLEELDPQDSINAVFAEEEATINDLCDEIEMLREENRELIEYKAEVALLLREKKFNEYEITKELEQLKEFKENFGKLIKEVL